jgi:hypothetical protein
MNLPKILNMPLFRGFGKRSQGILGFFGFEEFNFQKCFWNLFSTSGWSEICKISNNWKLPSPILRNTLISNSEKTSWSLKTIFWKKNCPINSKTVMKNFSHEISELHGIRTSKQEIPNYGNLYI